MRKSRTVVNNVEVQDSNVLNNAIFDDLKNMDIAVPAWAVMSFIFVRYEKMDVSFFEDAKDFFLWYSKIMIRDLAGFKAVSFSKIENEWKLFFPPTLIGVNLKTRLRE